MGQALPSVHGSRERHPIVVFIMRLFTTSAVTDDGVLQTKRAAAQDGFRARLGPICFKIPLRGRK